MIANALLLEAHERDGRTVVARVRAEGLWRASRPFREGGSARVTVSQLGPGMVRGDAFTSAGHVARGAHLIVGAQMATRVLSGPEPVTNVAEWTVETDGFLELIAEPTLVAAGAAYDARLTLHVETGARAHVVELVRREPGGALRVATTIVRNGRLSLVDTLRFDADDEHRDAIGTLLVVGPIDLGALDAATDGCDRVRIGAGVTRDGDTLARVAGDSVWDVREALTRLRLCARASRAAV